ncbi:hypothetical protein ANCCAN_10746 [Ancylostoma caninum]|uniref:Flavin reductase like domain-containing protein n=1 Tax=Ancylostoma caninum TaxID=29170 RepID=A0A368GK56_ANCCA|nr:hypothetical protein ANCCAN_10746 [Ancylostoma caninum]
MRKISSFFSCWWRCLTVIADLPEPRESSETYFRMPPEGAIDAERLEESCVFFECYLYPFSQLYDGIHIPLSISICVFGTISNIFNIIVLTRNGKCSHVKDDKGQVEIIDDEAFTCH